MEGQSSPPKVAPEKQAAGNASGAAGEGLGWGCGVALGVLLLAVLWFLLWFLWFLWTTGVLQGLFFLSFLVLGVVLLGREGDAAPVGWICLFAFGLVGWWIAGPGYGFGIVMLITAVLFLVSISETLQTVLGCLMVLAIVIAFGLYVYLDVWLPVEGDVEEFLRAVSRWWDDVVDERRSR